MERKQRENGVREIWEAAEFQRWWELKRGCLDATNLQLLDDLNEIYISIDWWQQLRLWKERRKGKEMEFFKKDMVS